MFASISHSKILHRPSASLRPKAVRCKASNDLVLRFGHRVRNHRRSIDGLEVIQMGSIAHLGNSSSGASLQLGDARSDRTRER